MRSHILPNAIFRRIKKNSSGRLIRFDNDKKSAVHYSQESYWERLLCKECEEIIRDYETYGLKLLRGAKFVSAHTHSNGVTFRNHKYNPFKLFLSSVVWRASVSKQDAFAKVLLPSFIKEEARLSLLNSRPLGPYKLGCKIFRLHDETKGFSSTVLRQFIISPVPRLPAKANSYSFLFIFEGFVFEFFVPTIPIRRRSERGIQKKSNILFTPFIEFGEIPELMNLLTSGYGKFHQGAVAFET